jgi:hypothetical protein
MGCEMKKLFSCIALLLSFNAYSFDYVYISDMSQLKWQLTTDGKVYLRNLSQFNAGFQGCCYIYWIDTSTPAGKAIWSAVLMKIGTAQPFYLGLEQQGGNVGHVGNW